MYKILKEDNKVKSIYFTSPYEAWNSKDKKYVSVCCDYENSQSYMDYCDFNFVIYAADVLLEGNTNFIQIQTTTQSIIMNFLNKLDHSSDELDIVYPVQYMPFEQQFTDNLAGQYLRFAVRVNNEYICND